MGTVVGAQVLLSILNVYAPLGCLVISRDKYDEIGLLMTSSPNTLVTAISIDSF